MSEIQPRSEVGAGTGPMWARRALIAELVVGFAGSLVGIQRAQAASPIAKGVPRIGRLTEGGPGDYTVFRAAMRELGYAEMVIEERVARGNANLLPGFAAELVRSGFDVIWTTGTVATMAAKDATQTIPVVMVSADAVGGGLIESLARPGGNLTGLTLIGTELVGKRIEILRKLCPGLSRVIAITHGPDSTTLKFVTDWLAQSRAATDAMRLGFRFVELSGKTDQWDGELRALTSPPGSALTFVESPFLLLNRELIASLLIKHRLPAVFAFQDHAVAGGLCAYGLTRKYIDTRVALYVSKILRGAKPSELPVEQPTKYELAIHLKTARTLGLVVPKGLLVQADRLIE